MTYVALDRRFVAWREDEGNPIQRIRDPCHLLTFQ